MGDSEEVAAASQEFNEYLRTVSESFTRCGCASMITPKLLCADGANCLQLHGASEPELPLTWLSQALSTACVTV